MGGGWEETNHTLQVAWGFSQYFLWSWKKLCVWNRLQHLVPWSLFTVHVPTDTRFSYILVIPPFDNLLSSVDNGFFETLSQRLEQELTQRYSPAVLAAERWESLCKDIGQTRGQSLGARFRWLCSKEAHGSDLEVILFSWLGWGKVVDVDNWQLLRVLCPKWKESPMPASILDLAREEGQRKSCLIGGWILLERNAFQEV